MLFNCFETLSLLNYYRQYLSNSFLTNFGLSSNIYACLSFSSSPDSFIDPFKASIFAGFIVSFSFIFNLNPFNPEGWVFHSISVYENESYHQESIHLYHDLHYEMKKNHTMVSIVSVILGFSGILMAYYLYIRNQGLLNRIYNRMHKMKLYHLSLNKFYF